MTELTAEIEETLKEYTQLQQEEQKLKERKHAEQQNLKAHLRSDDKNIWYPGKCAGRSTPLQAAP